MIIFNTSQLLHQITITTIIKILLMVQIKIDTKIFKMARAKRVISMV
jgi:hypothetical protein